MDILQSYVSNILNPTYNEISFIKSKLDSISNIIKNNSSLSLKEIRYGGSFIKGTMLKYKPEADIVLVFNKKSGKSRNWNLLMDEVKRNLTNAFPEIAISKGENIALHLSMINSDFKVDFDIVPSYYVNSPIQVSMIKDSKVYQGITTIWHVEYVSKFKSLSNYIQTVMLLKDWKDEYHIPLKSFHLELIAASAFTYRKPYDNQLVSSVDSCFREMQGMLDGRDIVPVDWEYYDDYANDKSHTTPCLIDPANPRENLLDSMTKEESKYLKKIVLKSMNYLDNDNFKVVFDPNSRCSFWK